MLVDFDEREQKRMNLEKVSLLLLLLTLLLWEYYGLPVFMDLFHKTGSFSLHKTLIGGLESCELLLCFYKLFGL